MIKTKSVWQSPYMKAPREAKTQIVPLFSKSETLRYLDCLLRCNSDKLNKRRVKDLQMHIDENLE
jgi:hypothetical protein